MDGSADAWASGRSRSRLAASTRTASAAYVGQIVIVQDSLRRSLTPTASNSDSHQDAFLMYERIYLSDVVQTKNLTLGREPTASLLRILRKATFLRSLTAGRPLLDFGNSRH